MKKSFANVMLVFTMVAILSSVVFSQTTEFVYQGQLQNASAPASGNFDFEFLLFDALSGPNQIGSTLTKSGVAVANGIFSVKLDFGANYPGSVRFLEIHVRQTGGSFTSLTPRQPVSSSPYSVKSLSADTATTATNTSQLGGVAANQFVQTNDTRLADDRSPLPGSSNYVQNSASQQAGANFNIGGNGTTGGTLSGQNVNSTFEYRLGGQPFMGAAVTNSRFGLETGSVNVGIGNTFAGHRSGAAATSNSSNNTFFGSDSGRNTSGGNSNSFFGRLAGDSNTSGQGNVFFGFASGFGNTTGFNNTLIGVASDVSSGNLSFATALGAGVTVSTSNTVVLGRSADNVRIPGTLTATGAITGTISNALNADNATTAANASQLGGVPADQFVQTGDPRLSDARSPLPGSPSYIQNQNATAQSSNFNIGGNGTASAFNANQYNMFGSRVLSSPGNFNLFAGINAGTANTTGATNAFFGRDSGSANTTGGANSFFGWNSGNLNSTGDSNSFFGWNSGGKNAGGIWNSFFGSSSGKNNTGGNLNSFFGVLAGAENISGSNNSFFGENAGKTNTIGNGNTALGYSADTSPSTLTNATAIGANALVSQSNSLVLGSINGVNGASADTNVGIGTTAPAAKLHINNGSIRLTGGGIYIANPNTLIITSPNGACWGITVNNAGALATFPVNPCP